MTDVDPRARQMLVDWTARYARPRGLGCGCVAHRDLGFCCQCVQRANPDREPGYGQSVEITGWRLLAMAERGMVDWTKDEVPA